MEKCVACSGKGWVDSEFKGAVRCPLCQQMPSREFAEVLLKRSRMQMESNRKCEHKNGTIGQKWFDQSVGAVKILEELLEIEKGGKE